MSLMDMIEQAAGSGAIQQIGARVGLSPDQLQNVIGSLEPALASKLGEHAATGNLQATVPPAGAPQPGSDAAEEHGRSVLGQIFGSKDVSRSVAADTSQQTGVDVDKVKSVLPQLASIAAAAFLAHKAAQQDGGLGGILGELTGGHLNQG